MISKNFNDIIAEDIKYLIKDKVPEGRTIEYKLELKLDTDKDKKEFLADFSSFANANGGDLIFGIKAEDGIPIEAVGYKTNEDNEDNEKNRLDDILSNGLDPRVHGYLIKFIQDFPKGPILIIRIPKSWIGPHMITYKNNSKFYTRRSASKYQMDTTELRSAFLLSKTISENIRNFRDKRLSNIISEDTPIHLIDGIKLVLHILPIVSFRNDYMLGFTKDDLHNNSNFPSIRPDTSPYSQTRYCIDGHFTSAANQNENIAHEYSLYFKSDQFEYVTIFDRTGEDGITMLPSIEYEMRIIAAIKNHSEKLNTFDWAYPLVILLSLLNVKGAYLTLGPEFSQRPLPFNRDILILPDIVIDNPSELSSKESVAASIRPAFDTVWNAAGFPKSINYDNNGNWKHK